MDDQHPYHLPHHGPIGEHRDHAPACPLCTPLRRPLADYVELLRTSNQDFWDRVRAEQTRDRILRYAEILGTLQRTVPPPVPPAPTPRRPITLTAYDHRLLAVFGIAWGTE